MPNVKFRASRRTLTSHAGLSIIGQCFEIAGVDSIDSRFPTTLGMRTSDPASFTRVLIERSEGTDWWHRLSGSASSARIAVE